MPYPPWLRTGPDPEPGRYARRSWRMRLFTTVLSIAVQLPGLAFATAGAWHRAKTGVDLWSVGAVLLGIAGACLLLLPWPKASVVTVAALAIPAIALAPGPPTAALAVAFAVARAVVSGTTVWAWCTIAVMGVAGVVWVLVPGGAGSGIRLLVATLFSSVVAAAVNGASTRRERFRAAAREAASRRRSAAEEERLRIARELHDVLAHSLSQISVQAGVGLHLFDDDPESARRSLRSIRETSATALDEVRGVLGMLRSPDDPNADVAPRRPEPTLETIPALLDDARRDGLEITVTGNVATGTWYDDGTVSAAVHAASYRIVQEALTNVLRHAASAAVAVEVDLGSDAVTIRVENGPVPSGGGPGTTQVPETTIAGSGSRETGGRGILGMTERAAALGGTLEAHPTIRGGFVVLAILPLAAGREMS
ncbi:sensor histidine kinase [Rathayibacter sp. KR2-224]|uniref:sensor histidine kinase n=1 Tax=Rathayibacter sp. KR2-224 TaxID=3400913 RepID=UPI003C0FE1E4